MELGERDKVQREEQQERTVWRERDQAMTAILKEKEALTRSLREALESAQRDVEVRMNLHAQFKSLPWS